MNELPVKNSPKRVLLSGVFGPFGVDDAYGRKENLMELFHNQVTKAQGLGSFRFHHRSFGLYFIAENIDADVTVLDFPSKERFAREVAKGYDIVGISFIAPNFIKAREMARLTRAIAPEAKIILGGHGAAIEGVDKRIDCDHVVRGEGIRWLRAHLGQDPSAPIKHPILPSAERMSIFGVPLPGPAASLLVPGVGCVNGCSFCCTTHFFGKRYAPFLASGRALFETARRIADARGTDHFFIMDENFLKDRDRAFEFLQEMERNQRFFRFSIFSSAEAITAFGLDNMMRLGVSVVWVGFESQSEQAGFAKNEGIDAKALVRDLRRRGISVLASGILCMEHHTPDNMQQDIDFMVQLEADFVQFMLLTPFPVTALYRRHQRLGMLDSSLPLEETHGQAKLNFHHPHFGGDAPEEWIQHAFAQDFRENSSSMYRVAETSLRGYEYLRSLKRRDVCLETRRTQFEAQAREYCVVLPAIARFAASATDRRKARDLDIRVQSLLARTKAEGLKVAAAMALVARWKLRLALYGDEMQPKTICTRYRAGRVVGLKQRLPRLRSGVAAAERVAANAAAMVALLRSGDLLGLLSG